MLSAVIDKKIHFLVGSQPGSTQLAQLPVLPVFDSRVLDFFDAVSARILGDNENRKHPDILTFGFWCRRSSLVKQAGHRKEELQLGRGVVFHVTPANLPVIFAYSLAAGLLAGNANIVRVPTKMYTQVDYICMQLKAVLAQDAFHWLAPYIVCVRYEREEVHFTKTFSAVCDVRIIWGGDSTISGIRNFPLKPKAYEVIFSDRYSLCVIDSNNWLNCPEKRRLIRGFYTDTYLNDQNACSSPQLILWLGNRVAEAQQDFWERMEAVVTEEEYPVDSFQSVLKLEHFQRMAVAFPGIRLISTNNRVMRIWTNEINPALMDFRPGGGFFIESSANDIAALLPLLEPGCQTIAYYGIDPQVFATLLREKGAHGIDRVVPIGNTLDFSLNWDGYDMISALSRKINIA